MITDKKYVKKNLNPERWNQKKIFRFHIMWLRNYVNLKITSNKVHSLVILISFVLIIYFALYLQLFLIHNSYYLLAIYGKYIIFYYYLYQKKSLFFLPHFFHFIYLLLLFYFFLSFFWIFSFLFYFFLFSFYIYFIISIKNFHITTIWIYTKSFFVYPITWL